MPHTSKPAPERHFGKFRGVVVDNIDPLQLARVLVQVPKVFDGDARWAMPCVPVAGHQSGLFLLPPVGAPVWVEFEQGDPELPIWVGGYWVDPAELPSLAQAGQAVAPEMVLQTPGQNALVISDVPGPDGGVVLRTQSGAMIAVNESGITISNGHGASIVLAGSMVTINDGALTVV